MITVAAALITRNNKIFIAQRPAHKLPPLQWEFPGGKQEAGETLPQALHRELQEELNIDAQIGDFFCKVVYKYEFATVCVNAYWATINPNIEISSNEHASTAWVTPEQMKNYEFTAADCEIVHKLQHLKSVA